MSKVFCFFGVHNFEIIKSGPQIDGYKSRYNSKVTYGTYYVLQCKCCGVVKKKIL